VKKSVMLKGYIFTIISAILFGCMPLMTKRIYADGVTSLSLVLFRNLISVPMLALLAYGQNKHLKVPAKALPSITAIGVTGCFLTPFLLYSSYNFMDSGPATVLHFVYPAVAAIGGFLIFKEKLHLGNVAGIIICTAGICMFYDPAAQISLKGSAIALVSGVTYACYIMLLSAFKYKETSGFLLSFYISATSSVLLFVLCLVTNQLTLPKTLGGWLMSVALAFIVNVGAVVLFQKGAFYIGGQRASILSAMEPITSVFIGALFLNEVIGWRVGIGTVLVLAASVIIAVCDLQKSKKQKAGKEE